MNGPLAPSSGQWHTIAGEFIGGYFCQWWWQCVDEEMLAIYCILVLLLNWNSVELALSWLMKLEIKSKNCIIKQARCYECHPTVVQNNESMICSYNAVWETTVRQLGKGCYK